MMGPGSVDAADADICGDFFDHIEDLLDFPSEEEMVGMGIGGGVGIGGDVGNGFLDECWPSVPDDLMNFSDSGLSGISCITTTTTATATTATTSTSQNTEDDLAAELSVSCEDIAQLEWLSNFVEDSFSAGSIDLDNDFSNKDQQFRTSSPVSVLESSSCSGKPMPLGPDTVVPGRARSKRPRPASFSPRPVPIVSPTTSSEGSNTNPLLVAASYPPELKQFAEPPPTLKKVPKKKKLTPPLPPSGDEETSKGAPVRKCMHCQIQKTPQWRMGPMGPKTLCNACGVRYKSGRLYPEYRPAASPTFVASVHSNSHKKVLEMRINTGQNAPAPVPEFVRKTSHLTADCN